MRQGLIVILFFIPLFILPYPASHYIVFAAYGFGIADAGCDIVEHELGKMESIDRFSGFKLIKMLN